MKPNLYLFVAFNLLLVSNIALSSSEYYKVKIVDQHTQNPIGNAFVFCDDRIIAISDSLGNFQLNEEVSRLTKVYTIKTISHKNKNLHLKKLLIDQENIVSLIEYDQIQDNYYSSDLSLDLLVAKSIENNIALCKSNNEFIAQYSQYGDYYYNNSLRSAKSYNESIQLKTNALKRLQFFNRCEKDVQNALVDLLDNHPLKCNVWNVIRKSETYQYVVSKAYFNDDINSNILELTATNLDMKNFSDTVRFTVRLADTTLVQFNATFCPNDNKRYRIYYPSVFMAYSFMNYDEFFPVIISNHYKYTNFKEKQNRLFVHNRYSSLLINSQNDVE
ncbi:MAG: hypothetical protein PHE33_03045 [Bacteroidales bacterium]|nr:hypothetical protein [Bacteroidales bacterium]